MPNQEKDFKDWKKILEETRKLEHEKTMTDTEFEILQKETAQEAKKLTKLLKPQWFVKDVDSEKSKKSAKKSKSQTKSL